MSWIRSHVTFPNVISLVALFVALGGTGYAAIKLPKNSVGARQIKTNGVGAAEIKRNAVGASELRANAVRSGDVADNGIGAADLADNSVGAGEIGNDAVGAGEVANNAVGGGEIADNAVGAGELANNAVGTNKIVDGSLLTSDFAPDQLGPTAFARVDGNGALVGGAGQAKGIELADIQHNAGPPAAESTGDGVYCFGGLDFTPRSALVVPDNTDALPPVPDLTGGSINKIASVAIFKGEDFSRCDAAHGQARVAIEAVTDTAAPTLANGGFFIWLQG